MAPAAAKKPTNPNADSGYHGLSEDDMDIDLEPAVAQSSAEIHDSIQDSPLSSLGREQNMTAQSDDRSTTEPSFHSAKEEITRRDDTGAIPEEKAEPVIAVGSGTELNEGNDTEQAKTTETQSHENVIDLNAEDKYLEEDLIVDESRTPSQGSSPARPLVRKSSLTFAALPAREPLTTKKSIGARVSRTSHLDQSKGPASRGSFLGRFTGGKSLGGYKQPGSEQAVGKDDELDIDMDRPALAREESEDSKMTKLHNKSSTQRLHERINMLGKSQPARPTKSIPAAAAVTNLSYPELPSAEPRLQTLQQTASLALKSAPIESNEEDEDDWIQAPHPPPNASSRPQLSKSVSTDVMEDIMDKQTIGGGDFDLSHDDKGATRELSPMHQVKNYQPNRPGLARAVSISESESPPEVRAPANVKYTQGTASPGVARSNMPASSNTPVGSPSSKRYVDGPLSASKSKLQSIMKTARGLFSSSAGVSAQAKMETLSPPSMPANEDVHGQPIGGTLQSKSVRGRKSSSPPSNTAGRKTRSSTEKEERRKESEVKERERAEVGAERYREQKRIEDTAQIPAQIKESAKPSRQSPRKALTQDAPKEQPVIVEDDASAQVMGPPPPHVQGQPSQMQRPKEARRPIRPAKEVAPKPKPQPVAIRVGTLSQGLRMNNTALSSSLQESLPPQSKQPAVTKKPSNASIHSAASNSSFKSSVTSAAAKPKALIAAERKKEQVSLSTSWLNDRNTNLFIG